MSYHNPAELSIVSFDKAEFSNESPIITQQEFNDWLKEYTFQALWGANLARAFCDKFQLTDYILWYTMSDNEEILSYIQQNYVSTTV